MGTKKIIWNENGWTTIQDADPEKHILEIACLSENGTVVEVRMRHGDGEVEVLKKKLDDNYSLPMPFADFKKAITSGDIKLK